MHYSNSISMHEYPFRQNVQTRYDGPQLVDELAQIIKEYVEVVEFHLALPLVSHGYSGGPFIDYIELAFTFEDLDHLGEHFGFLAVLQIFILEDLIP